MDGAVESDGIGSPKHLEKQVDQYDLLPLLTPGRTIKDLVTETGYRGPLHPLARDTINAWHRQFIDTGMPEFISELKTGRKELGAPQTEDVQVGPGMINILGVLHNKKNTPYYQAVTKFVRERIQNGEPWFFEQRLPSFFGLQGEVNELTDFDAYNQQRMQLTGKDIQRKLAYYEPRLLWRLGRQLNHNNVTYGFNKDLVRIKEKLVDQLGDSIGGFIHIQRFFDRVRLPEPLDIEASLVLTQGDSEDSSNLITDRSVIQARQVLSDVSTNNHQWPVGLLVGDYHRSQVKYLLTHPDYDPHASVKEARTVSLTH
ncbi:MAG TPA: hypothetical protein VLF93_01045 [Candidatus Saccharimonadales bacterium]|nr:hypothetical protein [Candidatus Saccharimonadales bacterium]